MSKIYITGIKGFIGSNLKLKLKKRKIKVKEFNKEIIKKNINFSKEILIHLGQSSVVKNKFNKMEVDFIKELNKLNFMHYIYISSTKIYDDINHKNYVKLKLKSEENFIKKKSTIFRCSNIYGPKQRKPNLLNIIINQLEKGNLIILDNLSNKIDYLWIEDLTDLIYKAIKFKIPGTFNVVSSEKYSVKQICLKLKKLKNLKKINIIEKKINIIKSKKIYYKKTENTFKWKPKINLDRGLKILLNENK